MQVTRKPGKSRRLGIFQIATALGALGMIALATIPAFWLKSYCSIAEPGQKPVAYHIAENSEHPKKGSAHGAEPSTSKLASPQTGFGEQKKVASPDAVNNMAPEPHSFWHGFFCEVNSADYTLALFTVLLALSTIALWLVTERTLRHAKAEAARQERDSRRHRLDMFEANAAAKRAANAASTAAAAAQKTADVGEKALTNLECPYIHVEVPQTGLLIDGTRYASASSFQSAFRNYGRTPALFTEVRDMIVVLPRPQFPTPIDVENDRGDLLPEGTMAAPNMGAFMLSHNLFAELSLEQREGIANDSMRAFFIGFVRFKDVLDRHHRVGWCMQFDRIGGEWHLRGGQGWNYSCKENPAEIMPHPTQQP